jgi:RimJ/RimL family protein N-acetyltransferase
MMIHIRKVDIHDVVALSVFFSQLYAESQYLAFDPGEWDGSVQKIKAYVLRIKSEPASNIFLAEAEHGCIVGYICGEVNSLKRLAHTMKVNVGILKSHRGQGVGEKLAEHLLSHAKQFNIVRTEATVIKENEPSLRLCRKFGMKVEGIKRYSILVGHKLYDEYVLSRILDSPLLPEKSIDQCDEYIEANR